MCVSCAERLTTARAGSRANSSTQTTSNKQCTSRAHPYPTSQTKILIQRALHTVVMTKHSFKASGVCYSLGTVTSNDALATAVRGSHCRQFLSYVRYEKSTLHSFWGDSACHYRARLSHLVALVI